MKRRVLAAFLAMMLTCGVAFPGNTVYAAEVTETTAESDAAVEETAVQTTDAEAEAKPEGSTEQPETTEAAEAAVTEATETEETEATEFSIFCSGIFVTGIGRISISASARICASGPSILP